MDIKRVVVALALALALLAGGAYAAWGDWDRSRIIGAGTGGDDRAEFAEALQGRLDTLTSAELAETCQAVRTEGLGASLAYIRERHYAQPDGPRMPFFDDIAERILTDTCLTVTV